MRVAAEQVEQSGEVTIIVTPEHVRTESFSAETPLVGKFWLKAKRVLPPWL
jgi:hypothetical protein